MPFREEIPSGHPTGALLGAPSTPQPSPESPTRPSEAARSPQQAPHQSDVTGRHHNLIDKTNVKINKLRRQGTDPSIIAAVITPAIAIVR
jgi:hypothetical protein